MITTRDELRGKAARQAMLTDPAQVDSVIDTVLDAVIDIRPLYCADEFCEHVRCGGVRLYVERLRALKMGKL